VAGTGRRILVLAVCVLTCSAAAYGGLGAQRRSPSPAQRSSVDAVWVQLGPDGTQLVRALTSSAGCPAARFDDSRVMLRERTAPGPNFAIRSCELPVPADVRRVVVGDRELRVSAGSPRRIAVLGDTGCRLKAVDGFQACNDPEQWPFAAIARSVADYRPDLIIDVGDYLYREEPCPGGNNGCAGSPWGKNWETWAADFFAPAQPALTAAPWVFVRGDHESCARAGEGWFRFLEPRPFTACADMTDPYTISAGDLRLLIMDTVTANDTTPDQTVVQAFAEQFSKLGIEAEENAWLLSHRPIWGLLPGDSADAKPKVFNATLQQAARNTLPFGVQLVLTGHVHLAEVLSFSGPRPAQMIAGISGTLLLPQIDQNVVGMDVDGVPLAAATIRSEHGFITFEHQQNGWTATIRDVEGKPQTNGQCHLKERAAICA
jgi:hypothetical protein